MFALTNGAFDYQEQVTLDDTMIFANSTASTMPGVPSVEGLYMLNLGAAAGGASRRSSTRTSPTSRHTADGQKLIYARSNGDLVMFGLQQNDALPLASSVTGFSLGPSRRGPVVYTTGDQALHVRPLLQPQTVTTVAGSVDFFSPIEFSPDAQHLYWLQERLVAERHRRPVPRAAAAGAPPPDAPGRRATPRRATSTSSAIGWST